MKMIFQRILLFICVFSTKKLESSPLLFANQDIFTGSLNQRSPPPLYSSVSNEKNNINYASGGPISVMEKLMPCKKGCFKTPSMKCKCQPITIIVDYPDSDENALLNNETSTTPKLLYTEATKYELHTNNSNLSFTTQNILNRSDLNGTLITLQEEDTLTTYQLSSSTISSALLTDKTDSGDRTTSGVERLFISLTRNPVIVAVVICMLYL